MDGVGFARKNQPRSTRTEVIAYRVVETRNLTQTGAANSSYTSLLDEKYRLSETHA
ncbi:protein of unknown function [Candidatus Filomicrobium marinum]|nr:protein of unknown function [Candidatus Filomicrobium marinum]